MLLILAAGAYPSFITRYQYPVIMLASFASIVTTTGKWVCRNISHNAVQWLPIKFMALLPGF